MIRYPIVAAVLFSVTATGWSQPASSPVTSPEVGADRRVTFRLLAPQAQSVLLTGEFMAGSRPLERDANGLWSLTIGPIEPEIYHYNFTIDGVRSIDPGNAALKTGSTFNTLASVLEIKGENRFKPWRLDVEVEPGNIRKIHAVLIPAVGGQAVAAAGSGSSGSKSGSAPSAPGSRASRTRCRASRVSSIPLTGAIVSSSAREKARAGR